MKILLTGSDGFIGSHYKKLLEQQGHWVLGADIKSGHDLCCPITVSRLPDVDVVVHFAALNGTKHFYNRPWDVVRSNILPTQYLLERYAESVKLFVQAGTCESYAGGVDLGITAIPTPETAPLIVTDINNPRWSYGGTKITNELQVTAAHAQFNMPYQIIRFHNVYGPGQTDHFIPEFVEKLRNKNFTVQGGSETRSFCFISDALDATLKLMLDTNCYNRVIHIGSDQEISIKHVAEMIAKKIGVADALQTVPGREGSVARRAPDISLLKSLIQWEPTVSLDCGLDLTLEAL